MLESFKSAYRTAGLLRDAVRAAMAPPIAPPIAPPMSPEPRHINVNALAPFQVQQRWDDGSKFPGGYGPTKILIPDYWTLRARSAELFDTNLFARGIVRRLVTNEIVTGLNLESTPEELLLGYEEDELGDWTEMVENRFEIWASNPALCDQDELCTWGVLQANARAEALIEGDVLITLRQSQTTGLPRVQLIKGSAVQTPWPYPRNLRKGSRIEHGVEIDAVGHHVAYWVVQRDRTSKRLPAYGEKSGRRLAWLMYGSDKRVGDVRGKPLLALVLQSLKEIDRYRDSVQRKAVVNSMLAMFIKKDAPVPGSRPFAAGAVRVDSELGHQDESAVVPRRFNVAELMPGLVLDELEQGETPHGFSSQGTDEKYGEFELTVIQGVAWSLEIPPEILTLSFRSNYSASQAALNEFKVYLLKTRTTFGFDMCRPVYEDWLISEALNQKIKAPRLLESWRDPALYDVYGAWTSCDWNGVIKPAVDASKLVRGYTQMVAEGAMTRDRMARELTGMKYSKVVKRLKRENEQLVEANKVMLALERSPPAPAPTQTAPAPVPAQKTPKPKVA